MINEKLEFESPSVRLRTPSFIVNGWYVWQSWDVTLSCLRNATCWMQQPSSSTPIPPTDVLRHLHPSFRYAIPIGKVSYEFLACFASQTLYLTSSVRSFLTNPPPPFE
jgi:hypothetical protein